MSRGVREYPDQPGAVTGVLFACLSLGGMVFPFLLGFSASAIGIERSYCFCAAIVAALLAISLRRETRAPSKFRMPSLHS
jgi:nitrate/nitrite transporter NarK